MPYSMDNPPEAMKGMPKHMQEIFIAAFNAAFDEYKGDEEKAHAVAWTAVKTKFEQDDKGAWRAKAAEIETQETFDLTLRMDAAKDATGASWDVTICKPGATKNGWYLPDEALKAGAPLFEGVDVNIYELPGRGATHVPDSLFGIKSLLTKNKAGWLHGSRHEPGEGIRAQLDFIDSHKWIGRNLLDGFKKGTQVYGLSHDAPVRATEAEIDGQKVKKLLAFLSVDSVDIVTRPAAGGRFNRAVAARPNDDGENQLMDKKTLWEMIQKARPELLAGKTLEAISDEEVVTLARMAMEVPVKKEDPPLNNKDQKDQGQDVAKEIALFRCEMALRDRLSGSELPELTRKRIEKRFSGIVFKADDLDAAIGEEKDYLAKMADAAAKDRDPVPAGSSHVGLGTLERAQMAVDHCFGLTKADMEWATKHGRLDGKPFFADLRSTQDYNEYDKVPKFGGLREMYEFFTGDPEVTGQFNRKRLPPALRASADITSATFTYVLGNTMGRRLVKDYNESNWQEDLLISIRKPVKDFRAQEAVMVGYFDDLATVDPEAADYAEIGALTDEESTYTILQKGNLLTITRKTIINDDLSLVQRAVGRLGRAARRTHAKYVWNFFVANTNCSDGTAWFTGGHTNLGAVALTIPNAIAAYKVLAKVTEKDSGERIGPLGDPAILPTLVYPIDYMEVGDQSVNMAEYYTANDLTTKVPNPLKGRIKGAMVSLLTDADDWGIIMPPSVIDCVEMGYLNGRQEPEMFIADMPQSEQVFVADKIRHKIRHEYAGAVIDWRSGYKSHH